MSLVRRAFAAGLVAAVVLGALGAGAAPSLYRNQRWGFCFAYPAGWTAEDGPDGSTLRWSARHATTGEIQPVLTVAGYRDLRSHSQPSTAEQPQPRGPQEALDDAVESLKDQMVRELRVSTHRERRWGLDALVSDIFYEQEGVRWHSRQIRVMRSDKTILELIVTAPGPEFASAKRSFDALVSSFEPACGTAGENGRQPPPAGRLQ